MHGKVSVDHPDISLGDADRNTVAHDILDDVHDHVRYVDAFEIRNKTRYLQFSVQEDFDGFFAHVTEIEGGLVEERLLHLSAFCDFVTFVRL
jgi:hypothetical protein